LQKTYVISKQAIVPSTVRSSRDLVEANSKLGLVSGLTGAVAIVPAAILLKLSGAPAALLYGAVLFFAAFVSALRLPRDVVAASEPDEEEERELHSASLQYASIAMAVLRAAVGFTFFHLAFWLRSFDNGTVLFGAAVAASAFSTMAGNALAPRIRSLMREETMLFVALILSSVAGLAFAAIGEPAAGIGLVAVLNFVAALGRLAFESIVQRDAPEANQGRAFATFETRFQFAWAVAAFIAVAVQAPGPVGLLIVGVTAGATAIHLFIRARRPGRSRSGNAPPSKRGPASSRGSSRNGATRRRRPPRGPTTGPGRRSRSGSESRKRR
jgi:hypothetical protein